MKRSTFIAAALSGCAAIAAASFFVVRDASTPDFILKMSKAANLEEAEELTASFRQQTDALLISEGKKVKAAERDAYLINDQLTAIENNTFDKGPYLIGSSWTWGQHTSHYSVVLHTVVKPGAPGVCLAATVRNTYFNTPASAYICTNNPDDARRLLVAQRSKKASGKPSRLLHLNKA